MAWSIADEDVVGMRRLGLALTVVLILSAFSFSLTILPENVSASTLYVGGSGPANYTRIQDAIDAANPGDTVYVYNGTYYENIVVGKALNLIGEDRNTTVVDWNGTGVAIEVVADWVNITGFTTENTGSEPIWHGIVLRGASNCTITNNNISLSHLGGILIFQSDNNVVAGNIGWNNSQGLYVVESDGNTIANNRISGSAIGIGILDSRFNNISGNHASDSASGIVLVWSDFNDIVNNTATNNMYGIEINWESRENTITNNMFLKNDFGVEAWRNPQNNTITHNDIISNRQWGFFFAHSNNNTIHHNNIIDNAQQAYDANSTNKWDDGYPSGGNYWSDYTGVDFFSGINQDVPGNDSIGDTPYVIDLDTQDRYPLMSPTGVIRPRPPIISDAVLSGNGLENVTIVWSPSPDDGAGSIYVTGYLVTRNTSYDSEGLGYGIIATLPAGTASFVDTRAGEGDPNNYFYRVCAQDVNNTTACSRTQAGKFTRPMIEGPNLASIPLIQSDESVEKVLQTVDFDKVWIHDSPSEKWKWFMTFKPYKGELRSINETQGFWVNVTNDCNFTVAGIVPNQTIIPLSKGWNLVGFPSFQQDYTVANLKADVIAERVEGFEALAPPYLLRLMLDGDILQPGYGYWVKVADETTWVVVSS